MNITRRKFFKMLGMGVIVPAVAAVMPNQVVSKAPVIEPLAADNLGQMPPFSAKIMQDFRDKVEDHPFASYPYLTTDWRWIEGRDGGW